MHRFLIIFGLLFFFSVSSFGHDEPWLDPNLKYPALDHIIESVGHTQCVEEPADLSQKMLAVAQQRYAVLHQWRQEYRDRFPEHFQDLAYKRLSLGMTFLRELCGDDVAALVD